MIPHVINIATEVICDISVYGKMHMRKPAVLKVNGVTSIITVETKHLGGCLRSPSVFLVSYISTCIFPNTLPQLANL